MQVTDERAKPGLCPQERDEVVDLSDVVDMNSVENLLLAGQRPGTGDKRACSESDGVVVQVSNDLLDEVVRQRRVNDQRH
jgi:hypothetical protein